MAYVITSVKVDEDKRQLAKQRGIKLQDLLDEALNITLQLQVPGKAQLDIEKEKILNDIELLEKQKQEYLEKYEHDMNELNIRLQFIDKQLAGANQEQKELEQANEREALIQRVIDEGGLNDELTEDITEYCLNYKIADINQELAKIVNKANERWRPGT